jgi:hypothetical protein
MGLDKRASSEPGAVTVIFRVPPEAAASSAEVLGEFTDWTPLAMQPSDDGAHEATIDLRGGSVYRFRYRLDGERWMNDWSADDYVPNEYGSDDSVVDLTVLDFAPGSAPADGAAPTPPTSASKAAKATKATTASKATKASRATKATKATKATTATKPGGTTAAQPATRARASAEKDRAPKQ